MYVGQSVDIRKRWERHHKTAQLTEIGEITIHYVKSDGRSLFQQESEWMNYCRPPLNIAGPRFYQVAQMEELREIPPNLTFFIYAYTSIPSVYFAMISLLFLRNQEWFTLGSIIFFCSTSFYAGSWFTWWLARNVYKAKTTTDWSDK